MRLTLIALVAATLAMGGCNAMQDVTAWLTGAPSNAEIDAERTKLDEATKKAAALEVQEQEARDTVARLTATVDGTEDRKAQVRALYARMAAELANLTGAAADAMVATMAGLQRQLIAISEEADAGAAMVAAYAAQADKLTAARRQAAIEIAQAKANLDGFAEATAIAINSTLAFVGLAGESAASLGVPGAREVTHQVTRIGEALIGLTLASGTGGMAWLARRRKKQLALASARAENLGRVVSAVEKFDLLNLPPGADLDTAMEGAKEWAGAAAHKELKRTLVENGNLAAA